jgi:hypothetical protein
MSAREKADTALTLLLNLLFLPGRLIEEGLHALASYAAGARVTVELDAVEDTSRVRAEWREGTPRWAVVGAHLAPEIVAGIAAVAVIAWWLVGNAIWWPATTFDWVLLCLLGAQYLAIAIPTAADASLGGGD